ncbi:GNAT family N-acetyltransferase [Alloalcanivorax mobilis]|uniref:GNAT family N-acetyltransferase n=1 Tax=Alloalcanivorax mobilis TaxID=2019569 RepID=UPI000C769FA2|nr:GNAT family N-acetyltransferase [Alloalcanivorax mobilis]
MPISVEFHPSRPELAQTFAQVLRDQPDYAAELELALGENRDLVAAHFNGKPVAVALLHGNQLAWMVVHPATRGRGVGRDFLRLIEKRLGHGVELPEKCKSS